MFSTLKAKASMVFACVALVALTVAQGASAALTVDAKDFTEPVEDQLTTAVPIVVGFIAAVFAVGLVIRWVMKRARSAS